MDVCYNLDEVLKVHGLTDVAVTSKLIRSVNVLVRARAKLINDSDIVNLQHEYGLFGGVWGEYVIKFLETLEKPVVTTLHTVLQEPVPDARRVMARILQHSRYVIVMARVGIAMLEQLYWTLADKVRYIPHGCHNVPYIGSGLLKPSLGLEGRVVLSTFGLISRGKGIEYAIQALPPIIQEEPKILYLIMRALANFLYDLFE